MTNLTKMQGLAYTIENDHLKITCNRQTHWSYLGCLRGVTQARIGSHDQPGASHVTLDLTLDGQVLHFNMPFNSAFEGSLLIKQCEELITALIEYTQANRD